MGPDGKRLQVSTVTVSNPSRLFDRSETADGGPLLMQS